MRTRQALPPVPPDRALPVVLQVAQPVRSLQQRGTISGNGVGEPDTVTGATEVDDLARVATHDPSARLRAFLDVGHEAIPPTVHGAHDLLRDAIVAHDASDGLDPRGQRGFAHEPATPDVVE